MNRHSFIAVPLLLAATLAPRPAPAQESPTPSTWPQFRGADSRGIASDPGLPHSWDRTNNVAWKSSIPGSGWSSPIVWNEHIFLTTAVNDGETEPVKKGLYFGGDRKEIAEGTHHWLVLCLDWSTGTTLWTQEVKSGRPGNPLHIKNSYASETPVTDGERVYAYFGNTGLFCFDTQGKPLWSKSWPVVRTANGWGSAASPVLHQDRIYIVNDNEDQSFITALDKRTGSEIWRVDRPEPSNWATPYVWKHQSRTEIITPGRNKIRSYDLNGTPLWELGNMSSIVIPTPFSDSGLLYVTSGYVGDNNNRPIYAIRPGASGDITLPDGDTSSDFIAWYQRKAGPYNPSPVLYGGYLYTLLDFGFLACYEAKTGRPVYDRQRINPSGRAGFTASPWAANGKIFCLSEDGDTFVVEAGPEYKLIGKNSLDELCMATPAIARGSLLIRTASQLYRIRNSQ